jgi:hypothetical protein
VVTSHELRYAELYASITVANGGLCKEYRYLKKPLVSGFYGVKLGRKISKNCWRFVALKFAGSSLSGIFHLTDDAFRPFSATNRQFNRNPIINEVGYSGSLMRSS